MQARLSGCWAEIGRVAKAAQLALGGVALVALAVPAEAAQLAEVRVGTHPGYTRVVLELDAPAGYRLEEPKPGSPELRLDLDATSASRHVASESPLVRSVYIEPSTRGSTVRIGLETPAVHVTEMILARPSRIVLDLRSVEQAGEGGAPHGTTGGSQAVADAPDGGNEREATGWAGQAVAAVPEPDETGSTGANRLEQAPAAVASAMQPPAAQESAGEARPGALELRPEVLERAAAAAMGEVPRPDPGAEKALELAEDVLEAPAADPAEGALDLLRPLDEAEPAGGELEEVAAEPPWAEELADAGDEAPSAGEAVAEPEMRLDRADLPRPGPVAGETDLEGAPGLLSGWKRVAVLGGGIVILLLAWLKLRRGGRIEPLTSALPEDEEFAEAAASGAIEEPEAEPQSPLAEPPEAPENANWSFDEEPVVALPEEEPTDMGLEPAPKVVQPAPVAAPAPGPASGGTEVSHQVEALEQRIAALESRLDEIVEASQRVERQVAAQTEELRVQRAAIARTQRVVRSLTRPEEAATEPVPRPPGRPGN